MRRFPHVTTIGDTTGGGLGNPVYRELPNGWNYRFSTWQEVIHDMEYIENTCIYPDIPAWLTTDDLSSKTDAILLKAIDLIGYK